MRLRGNEQLADHVQSLVRTGERSASEVQELASQLRSEQEITLSLDQELIRLIQDDVGFLHIAHAAWQDASSMTNAGEMWLYRRFQALGYGLLRLDWLQGVEETIRLALLVSLQNGCYNHGAQVAASVIASRLRAALRPSGK